MNGLPVRLRGALAAADFTYDAVAELLGPLAHSALSRNETTPGLRATAGGSAIETLTRLFLLQTPVSRVEAERALPGLLDELSAEGVVEQTVEEVGARLDVRPYAAPYDDEPGDLWIVSDLTPGLDGSANRVGADHVLGISPASTNLAQQTLRAPVGRSLDLGTGCGVQALHLARHSGTVVATDVNRRALWMTRFNAALNEVDNVDVREGSFFEPVAGESFDLIATNPPFVISPATGERFDSAQDPRLVYRDSGMPGDRVVEHVVRAAPDLLAPGGWCQVLANWVISRGVPWEERLGEWVDASCEAFVVQREVLDPAAYVELWLKDAGLHGAAGYGERYDTWLSWFDDQGVEGVGFGWINLRKTATGPSDFLEWRYDVEQPIAPAIGEWAEARDLLAATPDVSAARLVTRSDVRQESAGAPGAGDPETIVVRQQRGLRRARQVDTVEAAVLGACDGDLTIGQLLAAIAQILERDEAELRATYLPVVSDLVREGFLTPGPSRQPVGWGRRSRAGRRVAPGAAPVAAR